MTPEALAELHARCFAATPRPWSAAEFADLLAEPSTLLVSETHGFALARVIAPEAEILTLAVDPAQRRQGIGRRLVQGLEAAAAARGVRTMFLEVASTNDAACVLYARLGYAQVGRRAGYYAPGVDALLLSRDLVEGADGDGKTI